MMKKVVWLSSGDRMNGGFSYGAMVRRVVHSDHQIVVEDLRSGVEYKPLLRPFVLLKRLWSTSRGPKPDVIIRDALELALLPLAEEARHVLVVHHVDHSQLRFLRRQLFRIVDPICLKHIRRAHAVVTVSRYWQDWFVRNGFSNVTTIYNAVDEGEFSFSEVDTNTLRQSLGLWNKPVVYIGNADAGKGVVEVFHALKDLPLHLVTSGDKRVSLPARHFCLPRRDYLKLLASADLTITMSRFPEGWCMTAHESLMARTPVVGSGLGGMRELLNGAGQVVCEDVSNLRSIAQQLLGNAEKRRSLAVAGHAFARSFTMERMRTAWNALLTRLEASRASAQETNSSGFAARPARDRDLP